LRLLRFFAANPQFHSARTVDVRCCGQLGQ
jgi:hypothetical protein